MNNQLPFKIENEEFPTRPDVIIVDGTVKLKIKLTPSMFLRGKEGQPAVAVITQKLEDIFGDNPSQSTVKIR